MLHKEESFEFQAEIKQLLHILVYSLYTKKEVFIRELISNASDALDKMRYKMLVEPDVEGKDIPLEIRITLDENHNIFSITDTGIGMTKTEVIQNIGTIAKSGTLDFIKKLTEEGKNENINLIGQFGVGFYSCFMAAQEVYVLTKSYITDEPAHNWHSDGSGKYKLNEIESNKRGTRVEVHLKDDEKEFVNKERVESIIRRYSNFVPYPIFIDGKQVNQVDAIWTKPKGELKKEDYDEFYKFLTNSFEDPHSYIHIASDAPLSFHSILYLPKTNLEVMGLGKIEHGLSLYSKKVLIQAECKDILPDYLRFVRGVVDSEDISLNISRESIQDNIYLRKIKNFVIKKMLEQLSGLLKNKREEYIAFWKEFGRILKEGIAIDFANREKVADLLLLNSSKCTNADELITLKEYTERMPEEQKEIYYLSGFDRVSVQSSPHIEIFTKKGIEVLYFYDPLDDIIVSHLMMYSGKLIKSVDHADIELLKSFEDKEGEAEETIAFNSKFDMLLNKFKEVLTDKVLEVKESKRLSESPCVLLNPEHAPSSSIQKIMSMMNKDFQMSKKILEINKRHPLIRNLAEINSDSKNEQLVKMLCEQLYDNAVMLEGIIPKPSDMIPRLQKIMEQASKVVMSTQ
ncbi:MAG TPA: molecular chaperone HtpG [Thermodesulfovibrionia bacterium]|nr:molecular chaperone HtpG [Thermodesulfovibrionia bacterium]